MDTASITVRQQQLKLSCSDLSLEKRNKMDLITLFLRDKGHNNRYGTSNLSNVHVNPEPYYWMTVKHFFVRNLVCVRYWCFMMICLKFDHNLLICFSFGPVYQQATHWFA